MDIHRCRFAPYPPSAINALAFSHASDKTKKVPRSLRLALGRANGDVEIWNPRAGHWYQETILRGGRDRSIDSLTWTQETLSQDDANGSTRDGPLRLFSIGDSPTVTEWDLATGAPARHADGNSGDIWCLAAQPRPQKTAESESSSQLLAAGCGNGTIVLFSTEDNDLRFLRTLGRPPVKKPKVLSLAWRDRDTLVAGYDDSMIRLYSISRKTTIRGMSLGKPVDSNESYVWCVTCLPDGTIVSGDSTGELKIWDAKNYSLVQRLKTHEGDILDVGSNATGDMIVSVGVDRRTVSYKPAMSQKGSRKQRWTKSMHRRLHQHDIKAITTFESKELSVMVSGGIDTAPIVAPLRQWQNEYHRTLSHLPQKPQVSSARNARLAVTWWSREVCIWHIPKRDELISNPPVEDQNYQLVARIILEDDENITSAQISEAGNLLVIATAAGIKVFQLRRSSKAGRNILRSRSVRLPASVADFGAKVVKFSPSGSWLCAVRLSNEIILAKILPPVDRNEQPQLIEKVVRLVRKSRGKTSEQVDGLGPYGRTISDFSFSADGRVLAAADVSGAIDTWLLEGHEDLTQQSSTHREIQTGSSDESSDSESDDNGEGDTIMHGQKWIRNPAGPNLPQLDSAILTMSFRPHNTDAEAAHDHVGLHATRHNPTPLAHELPHGEYRLIAVTAGHQIVEFDVLGCRLSDWTRRNPASCLPHDFIKIKDRVMGSFWACAEGQERLWLYGPTWLFMFDMAQDLPASPSVGRLGNYEVLEPTTESQRKRTMDPEQTSPSKRRNTGAGDEIRDRELYIGVGRSAQRFKEGSPANRQIVPLIEPMSLISDIDNASTDHTELVTMRRKADDEDKGQLTDGELVLAGSGRRATQAKRPGWWFTYDYRSIFGISPVGRSDDDHQDSPAGGDDAANEMEVVVFERPIYDVDFPDRFDGGQDWET